MRELEEIEWAWLLDCARMRDKAKRDLDRIELQAYTRAINAGMVFTDHMGRPRHRRA